MNFRSERRDEVDLDITPLIDVVFLLLIFFMVSTTFEHNSEINITLPSSSKEVTDAKPDAVNVGLDAQGNVYINDKSLVNAQLETIKAALSDALVGLNEPPVIISADSNATHQSVVRVMDAARQLGLVKITFATQELKDE
ncbi:MAG: biopolymer transporter ExbD [marine bacterium B5-7]|nr:MAG: biopolymer transporter ExbD [marine bacterium B5-7]|tara:strand:- start:580 stop:999 length:420 start_codon:yes stop_codon:yes gene_type:complete